MIVNSSTLVRATEDIVIYRVLFQELNGILCDISKVNNPIKQIPCTLKTSKHYPILNKFEDNLYLLNYSLGYNFLTKRAVRKFIKHNPALYVVVQGYIPKNTLYCKNDKQEVFATKIKLTHIVFEGDPVLMCNSYYCENYNCSKLVRKSRPDYITQNTEHYYNKLIYV